MTRFFLLWLKMVTVNKTQALNGIGTRVADVGLISAKASFGPIPSLSASSIALFRTEVRQSAVLRSPASSCLVVNAYAQTIIIDE